MTNDTIPLTSFLGTFSTQEATQHLSKIIPNKTFMNPKPVPLIKKILEQTSENAIVLDFFAGSGTTAEAVIEQNKIDGGHRRFICCTKKYDFNSLYFQNIGEDIMLERIEKTVNEKFDVLITKAYNISLNSKNTPYQVIDLSLYGYEKNVENKKIIDSNFNILLSHLNKGGKQ
jgi:adenine specific DNA methylase Mod